MFQEFPKWKYKGADSAEVQDAAAELALGDGWGDVPGFGSADPVAAPLADAPEIPVFGQPAKNKNK